MAALGQGNGQQQMNKTRILQVTGALGAAVLTLFVARNYLAGGTGSPEVVVKDNVEKVQILAAAKKIEMGSKIGKGMLHWVDWPKDMVTASMIVKKPGGPGIKTFVGGRAQSPLFPGEPIVKGKILTVKEGGVLSAMLPKGMRAIAVRVSVATGAGGFIMPNDRVDVLLTRKVKRRTITDTVLSNVRVLAINQTYKLDKDGKKVADPTIKTATLELEPEQAEQLARAESLGQLALVLRSMADIGDSELGDDGPRLSAKFARGKGGEVRILRYGIPRYQARN